MRYTFNYDSLGRKTSVTVSNGSSGATEQVLSTNVYSSDRKSLLNEVQYGNGGKVKYSYDEYDRVTGITHDSDTDPKFRIEYDSRGRAARVTDAEGGSVTNSWDTTQRLVESEQRDGSDGLRYRNLIEYDNKNRVNKFHEVTGSGTHKTEYQYDKDNRVKALRYDGSNNYLVNYTFDKLNRITGRKITNSVEYNTAYGYVQGNTAYGTNATTPLVASITQGSGTNAFNLAYTYDDRGNITSETRNGNITTYEYDALGQLVRVNDKNDTTGGSTGTTWIYAYDRGGNILSKTAYAYTAEEVGTAVRTYTYGYTDTNWKDKLTVFDNSTITYDAIGNPLSDGTWTYVWQAGRQLKSMTKVDGNDTITVEFEYDHAGLRTKKTKKVNNAITEVTEYILNGKNVVELKRTVYTTVGEETTTTVDVLHFYYDAQGRAAMVKYNGVMYGYVHDLQGDVIGILDSTGSVAVEYKYDAWGKPLSVTGTLAASLGEINPFRYRGYVFDQETQLYYLRSRYYNSIYHRFHNSDIEYDGNIFIYCNNNPCIYYDPTGEFTEEDYKYDWAGLAILLHWLTGNGKEYVVSGGRWRDYLNSAPLCTEKGCDFPEMPLSMYMLSLYRDIGSTVGEGQSYNDSGSFHLSFKNGEGIIGYNYLHGSNENYGGFSYTVNITKNYGYRVYSFIFNFNDRIDPNYKYATDAAKAEFAKSLPFVNPTDYTIRITWGFEYVDFINGTSH